MTLQTFNPPLQPSVGSSKKPEFNILEAEFGNGYTAPAPAGINHVRRVLELNWEVLTADQAYQINTFLTYHGGTKPFLYLAPGEASLLKFTCNDWTENHLKVGLRSLTAKFRQSFNLVT